MHRLFEIRKSTVDAARVAFGCLTRTGCDSFDAASEGWLDAKTGSANSANCGNETILREAAQMRNLRICGRRAIAPWAYSAASLRAALGSRVSRPSARSRSIRESGRSEMRP